MKPAFAFPKSANAKMEFIRTQSKLAVSNQCCLAKAAHEVGADSVLLNDLPELKALQDAAVLSWEAILKKCPQDDYELLVDLLTVAPYHDRRRKDPITKLLVNDFLRLQLKAHLKQLLKMSRPAMPLASCTVEMNMQLVANILRRCDIPPDSQISVKLAKAVGAPSLDPSYHDVSWQRKTVVWSADLHCFFRCCDGDPETRLECHLPVGPAYEALIRALDLMAWVYKCVRVVCNVLLSFVGRAIWQGGIAAELPNDDCFHLWGKDVLGCVLANSLALAMKKGPGQWGLGTGGRWKAVTRLIHRHKQAVWDRYILAAAGSSDLALGGKSVERIEEELVGLIKAKTKTKTKAKSRPESGSSAAQPTVVRDAWYSMMRMVGRVAVKPAVSAMMRTLEQEGGDVDLVNSLTDIGEKLEGELWGRCVAEPRADPALQGGCLPGSRENLLDAASTLSPAEMQDAFSNLNRPVFLDPASMKTCAAYMPRAAAAAVFSETAGSEGGRVLVCDPGVGVLNALEPFSGACSRVGLRIGTVLGHDAKSRLEAVPGYTELCSLVNKFHWGVREDRELLDAVEEPEVSKDNGLDDDDDDDADAAAVDHGDLDLDQIGKLCEQLRAWVSSPGRRKARRVKRNRLHHSTHHLCARLLMSAWKGQERALYLRLCLHEFGHMESFGTLRSHSSWRDRMLEALVSYLFLVSSGRKSPSYELLLVVGSGSFSGQRHGEALRRLCRLPGVVVMYTSENWTSAMAPGGHLWTDSDGQVDVPVFDIGLRLRSSHHRVLPPTPDRDLVLDDSQGLNCLEGFYRRQLMRVERLPDGHWSMRHVSKDGVVQEQQWLLAKPPVLLREHRAGSKKEGRRILSIKVKEYTGSWHSRVCLVAGCGCSGCDDTGVGSGRRRWVHRDKSAALMIFVLFLFFLATGRTLTGYYCAKNLATAQWNRELDKVTTHVTIEKEKTVLGEKVKIKVPERLSMLDRISTFNRVVFATGGKGTKTRSYQTAWLNLICQAADGRLDMIKWKRDKGGAVVEAGTGEARRKATSAKSLPGLLVKKT